MSDPTTPAAPEEPTPGAEPVVPAAEPVAAPEPVVAPAAPVAEPAAAPAAPVVDPAAPANPYAAPAAGYAPAQPVKQTLSIVSFILGIIGVLLAFAWGLGLIPGIVAVILGFRGKKKEPEAPKWMSLTGIITGFVAIGISVIVGLITIVGIVFYLIALNSIGGSYSDYVG